MPSTYSPSLRLELIGAGEQAANWGNTTNYNLGTLLEQAIAGVQSVAVSGASYTLTTGSGVADEARNAVLVLTGTLAASCNVIVPTADKTYTFRNATTGGFSVVVKTAAGLGVTIANGFTQQVYCDATNVVAAGVPFNNAANSIAADLIGNVTGNLTGNVTGNVTGVASGNVLKAGDTMTGALNFAPEVDLASAGTTDIGAQTSNNVRITGTTTITSFGTAAGSVTRQLRFAAALTLTYNATSLILPGATNITTAAGDTATAVSLGSGNWVVTAYQRALSFGINRGTSQPTTSGVQFDFTSIPAGVRRIKIIFFTVSTNGTNPFLVQIGSGSIQTTGYNASGGEFNNSSTTAVTNSSAGFIIRSTAAANSFSGIMELNLESGNNWVSDHRGATTSTSVAVGGGAVALSGVLDRLRITTVGGTDTFDTGAVNIMWEF